jgi:spore germination protein YaaH
VQNFNLANTSINADFDPQLAHGLLKSDTTQAEFVKSLQQTLVAEGWDGVVIDFENLNAEDQKAFVHFLKILHKALASKIRLVAAVPPRDPGYASSMNYDLPGISNNTDLVNVMTYNQHDPSGKAGPIGEPAWIKASLANVY